MPIFLKKIKSGDVGVLGLGVPLDLPKDSLCHGLSFSLCKVSTL